VSSLLTVILVAARWAEAAAMDKEKHQNIAKIVEITGVLQNAMANVDRLLPQLINTIRKVHQEIPQEVLDALEQEGREEFHKAAPELIAPIIAIYDSNYSAEEIRELLAFYQSPFGRKLTQRMSQMALQTVAVAAAWGKNAGARVSGRIRVSAKEKGYDLERPGTDMSALDRPPGG
jgi:uncharacterized protein